MHSERFVAHARHCTRRGAAFAPAGGPIGRWAARLTLEVASTGLGIVASVPYTCRPLPVLEPSLLLQPSPIDLERANALQRGNGIGVGEVRGVGGRSNLPGTHGPSSLCSPHPREEVEVVLTGHKDHGTARHGDGPFALLLDNDPKIAVQSR